MMGEARGEIDRLHIGLAERVGRWSLVAWVLATAGMVAVDARAAAGFALGGGVSLGLFTLHRALASMWMRPPRRRAARAWPWAVWLVKYPAVGTLLYVALMAEWVTPGWVCVGVGLVPAVATALALRALAVDRYRTRTPAEAG